MVLIGLAIQPLAASLFTVKQVWWNGPSLFVSFLCHPLLTGLLQSYYSLADLNVANLQTLGLDPNFGNLTAFSTASQ